MGGNTGEGFVHVGTEVESVANGSVEGTSEGEGIVGKVAVFTKTHLRVSVIAKVEFAGIAGFFVFHYAGIGAETVIAFKVEAGSTQSVTVDSV